MFHSARIRLTLWYVLIIISLTSFVSAFMYLGLNQELQHIERMQDVIQYKDPEFFQTFESDHPVNIPVPEPQPGQAFGVKIVQTDVSSIRWRIISTLVMINTGIAVVVGLISYFLAGKTLKPIQIMMEEQRRFLADASHELRTPLTSLRTATEVSLRDKDLSLAEAKNLLKDNLEEIKNLQYLSEGLLRLSSLENREANLKWRAVSVAEIVSEAVKKVTPQARAKKIELISDKPSISVKGDKLALIEVLVIMLDNAIKYSPKNTQVAISTQKRKDLVIVKISDQGTGIETKDIPYIFERFYRADQSRSSHFGSGYGLGLPIAQRIMEQHHGRIEVKSQPGSGSIFSLSFPQSRT